MTANISKPNKNIEKTNLIFHNFTLLPDYCVNFQQKRNQNDVKNIN